jgi:polysaccharide export outer membrane protein
MLGATRNAAPVVRGAGEEGGRDRFSDSAETHLAKNWSGRTARTGADALFLGPRDDGFLRMARPKVPAEKRFDRRRLRAENDAALFGKNTMEAAMSKQIAMFVGPVANRFREHLARWARGAVLALAVATVAGCQATRPGLQQAMQQAAARPEVVPLREGDVVRVTFPGSPNLDTQPQPIRRDGNISLPLIGEVKAAGLTPSELEKALAEKYAPQLVIKEVRVNVVSSRFEVYVTGAVLRPGKVTSDHPLTALEAIMEAGGPDYTKANLKTVTVIRHEDGRTQNYTINLRNVLRGQSTEPFYLKPSDIVFVPERFTWF